MAVSAPNFTLGDLGLNDLQRVSVTDHRGDVLAFVPTDMVKVKRSPITEPAVDARVRSKIVAYISTSYFDTLSLSFSDLGCSSRPTGVPLFVVSRPAHFAHIGGGMEVFVRLRDLALTTCSQERRTGYDPAASCLASRCSAD